MNLPRVDQDGWDMRAMHKNAQMQRPNLPIKLTSTWIAVVYHSTKRSADIPRENGFLWMKAHPYITVKTLRYKYFERHPLDGLFKTFNGIPLDDEVQVGHLRRASVFGDNIIVLRAIEGDMSDEEENCAVVALKAFKDAGMKIMGEEHDPIALGSDDEDSDTSESGSEELSDDDASDNNEKSDQEQTHNRQNVRASTAQDSIMLSTEPYSENFSNHFEHFFGNGGNTPSESNINDDSQAIILDPDDEQPVQPTTNRKRKHDSNSVDEAHEIAFHPTAPEDPSNRTMSAYSGDAEGPTSFKEEYISSMPEELQGRILELPLVIQAQLCATSLQGCEKCGKPMYLRAWTRFGELDGPLCTKHSRAYLESKGYDSVLQAFDDKVEEAGDEKTQGDYDIPPNMDDDFPGDIHLATSDLNGVFGQQNEELYGYSALVQDYVRPDSPSQQLLSDMGLSWAGGQDFNGNDYALFGNSNLHPNNHFNEQGVAPQQLMFTSSPPTAQRSAESAMDLDDAYNTDEEGFNAPFFTSCSSGSHLSPNLSPGQTPHHQVVEEDDEDSESTASEPEYLEPSTQAAVDSDEDMTEAGDDDSEEEKAHEEDEASAGAMATNNKKAGKHEYDCEDDDEDEFDEVILPIDAAQKDDEDDEDYEYDDDEEDE